MRLSPVTIYLLLACMALSSCTSSGLYRPLPKSLENKSQMIGFHDIRAWGDASSQAMERSAQQSVQQMKAAHHGKIPTEINALAISGGGADGAFGAGILYGWTKTGKRPEFHLVSGISTGALIAPLAFLGPEYDGRLKELYTTISDEQIYKLNNPLALMGAFIRPVLNRSLASNEPMKKIMRKIIDEDMVRAIAREHLKGKRLFIGTSQINAERLVIWDIGAIAASGNPGSIQLIHKILLASSALPGIFPPEYFPVEANGKQYKEMHLDGGLEAQVMLYEKAIAPFSKLYVQHEHKSIKKLYIIRNRKVAPEWDKVKPRLHYILERAISMLTKNQGIGDLYRLYAYSVRDKVDYNLMYIPPSFTHQAESMFDKQYMKELFKLGEQAGRKAVWKKYPPGLYKLYCFAP